MEARVLSVTYLPKAREGIILRAGERDCSEGSWNGSENFVNVKSFGSSKNKDLLLTLLLI